MSYRHTQTAWLHRLIFSVVAAAMATMALRLPLDEPVAARYALFGVSLLLLFIAFWMTTMTIAVRSGQLTWHFGLGLPRYSVAIGEIENVTVTRTRWWMGWGVRWTVHGWLYNVAGRDVVVVSRKGARPVMLGTDEPKRLHAALERALHERRA